MMNILASMTAPLTPHVNVRPAVNDAASAMNAAGNILQSLWMALIFVGVITVGIGLWRWVSGGKAHDSEQQSGAVWTIATGAVMIAFGAAAGVLFPNFDFLKMS